MMDMEGEDKQAEVTAAKSQEQQESMTGAMREQTGGRAGMKDLLRTALRLWKAWLVSREEKCLSSPISRFLFYSLISFYYFIVFDVGFHVVQADLKLMTDLRLALNSFSSCLQLSRAGIPVIHTTPSKLIFSKTSL